MAPNAVSIEMHRFKKSKIRIKIKLIYFRIIIAFTFLQMYSYFEIITSFH